MSTAVTEILNRHNLPEPKSCIYAVYLSFDTARNNTNEYAFYELLDGRVACIAHGFHPARLTSKERLLTAMRDRYDQIKQDDIDKVTKLWDDWQVIDPLQHPASSQKLI